MSQRFNMLRLVVVFLVAYLTSVILARCPDETPLVLIDGYTVNKSFESEANLPLGTTLVLVCRVSGIPNNVTPNYTWTCPNGPCTPQGYEGRMIQDNVLAINITSTRDDGTYTCNVTAEGCDAGSKNYPLKVTGGKVVHSYGRLIIKERVISKRQQLQPPNKPKGDGRIECRVSSGGALFQYYGSERIRTKINQTIDDSGFNTTVVIRRKDLRPKKFAIEGECGHLFHYLFLKKDASCTNLTLDYPRVTELQNYLTIDSFGTSITVTIKNLPDGIARAIVGYAKLNHGVWVEGEYANLRLWQSRTFSSLVPGAKYRVTAWGLRGGNTDDRRRCRKPTVMYVSMSSQRASGPRLMNVTGDGNMHWIHPKEPNGEISHFNIKYTMKNGTEHEVNTTSTYHTLTGMEREESYNITLMAVNTDGLEGENVTITYLHLP